MAKRNILAWGGPDDGKSTFAASIMAAIPQPNGPPKPARWPRVDWYNLDKPGVGSIAGYFREGTGARLIEIAPDDWSTLAFALGESAQRAKSGDIDGLVVEGLAIYYRDNVGLAALDKPDAITAGGNATRALYKAPTLQLEAILAGLRRVSARAKNPDFLTVLTAHAKEIGEGTDKNPRRRVPGVSRNAWSQFVSLCEVVIELKRPPRGAPGITYSRAEDEMVLARVNNDDALAYLDRIHADKNKDAIAQMRTLPGLIALLEHGERAKQKRAAAADAPATVSETT